jgi:hypothetical protein
MSMTSLNRPSEAALILAVCLALAGCGGDAAPNPAAADTTYGTAVDATGAIPVPAVAAEANRYTGRPLTVDGRIADVRQSGCTLHLATGGGPPLRVDAARIGDSSCAWRVPTGEEGIAVAAGTLRVDGDTLRLSANGVQVTPVRLTSPAP